MINERQETFIDRSMTYTTSYNGRVVVIENVPCRECVETGEQLFAAETMDRIQEIIWNGKQPVRTIEAAVFDFAA